MATLAERSKQEKYPALNQHYTFTPVAIKTAGPCDPETFVFLRELGCHLKQVTGEAKLFSYLRQRLIVAVQRGNATAVMGTMGGTTSPLISFLDCLFLFGALKASPLTDCLFSLICYIIIVLYWCKNTRNI